MTYETIKTAEVLTVPVRSLDHRVYRWGDPDAEPVILIHGWADTGLSFQFTADVMPDDWCLLAPDMRGFGGTDWNQQGYWFPDYLVDLDILIEKFSPTGSVRLVGHSMGGNIVTLYAGVCPGRVSHVVSLDQYGLSDSNPEDAPARYEKWIKQWRNPPEHARYDDMEATVKRLMNLAPYLDEGRARYLAPSWSRPDQDGKYQSRIDPGHKRVNPVLYRREEVRACWRRVTARALLVLAEESRFNRRGAKLGMLDDFSECFTEFEQVTLPDCGHMLHLDQPAELARILDDFLRR